VYEDTNGVVRGSRKLSRAVGSVGQYVYNSDGRAEGMPDVQHLVTLIAMTVKGSAAAKELGNRFYEARYVTPNLQQEQEAHVAEAFKPLVDKELLRIDGVVVEPRNGMPTVTHIRMTDLTTGLPLDELTLIF
jgi:hypothetical protein